jgi:hypothetical protein
MEVRDKTDAWEERMDAVNHNWAQAILDRRSEASGVKAEVVEHVHPGVTIQEQVPPAEACYRCGKRIRMGRDGEYYVDATAPYDQHARSCYRFLSDVQRTRTSRAADVQAHPAVRQAVRDWEHGRLSGERLQLIVDGVANKVKAETVLNSRFPESYANAKSPECAAWQSGDGTWICATHRTQLNYGVCPVTNRRLIEKQSLQGSVARPAGISPAGISPAGISPAGISEDDGDVISRAVAQGDGDPGDEHVERSSPSREPIEVDPRKSLRIRARHQGD